MSAIPPLLPSDWDPETVRALAAGIVAQQAVLEKREGGMRVPKEREFLDRLRRDLERAAAELTRRQARVRGDADRLRAELAARERLVDRREQVLNELFQRLRHRRQAEVDRFRNALQVAVRARQALLDARNEWHRRAEELEKAQQALAAESLALEEAKQQFLAETDRPEADARRLERLRRRWHGRTSGERRELDRYREELDTEDSQLCRIFYELQDQQTALAQLEVEHANRITDTDNDHRRINLATRELETAQTAWREIRRAYEMQLTDLRTELERLTYSSASDEPPALAAA